MNLHQLTAADLGALEMLTLRATDAAAGSLAKLVGRSVDVGRASCEVTALSDAVKVVDGLPASVTVIYLEARGRINGHLLLVLGTASAATLVQSLVPELPRSPQEREALRVDALSEIGNIVLTGYLNELVKTTGLSCEPSVPMVANDVDAAALELPLVRAAGDHDAVLQLDATLALADDARGMVRAPVHVMFLPAPGCLSPVLDAMEVSEHSGDVRIPVRMGELVVSRRPGDVLVASALGSCIGVAITDRRARIVAMAHVMLPTAPSQWRLAERPTYAARYADSAIPALIEAIERAGGRAVGLTASIAGGGQMFQGRLAEAMTVPERNIEAVKAALERHSVRLVGEDTGGSSARTLQVEVATLEATVRSEASAFRSLDQAA